MIDVTHQTTQSIDIDYFSVCLSLFFSLVRERGREGECCRGADICRACTRVRERSSAAQRCAAACAALSGRATSCRVPPKDLCSTRRPSPTRHSSAKEKKQKQTRRKKTNTFFFFSFIGGCGSFSFQCRRTLCSCCCFLFVVFFSAIEVCPFESGTFANDFEHGLSRGQSCPGASEHC